MTDAQVPDQSQQTGFGFASYLLVLSLIARLVNTNKLSRQDAREVIDHSLLNAEMHQSGSPFPEMVRAARGAIEMALAVLEAQLGQSSKGR